MEQLKILEIINRWWYLNIEQIALLLTKRIRAVDTLTTIFNEQKNSLCRPTNQKNIYTLSSFGNRKLGKKNKTIKINYNELAHQDLLIKWLCPETDIISYEIEKELKNRKLSRKRIS